MRPRFRRLSHTADVRLLVWGDDLPQLFTNALTGAQTVAFGHPPRGRPSEWRVLSDLPDQLPLRLVRVVNEGLFALFTLNLVVTDVHLEDGTLSLGVRPRRNTELLETEIKAATLHDLHVHQRNGRWQAVITLDL